MGLNNKIFWGLASATALVIAGDEGFYGSRTIEEVHSFQYHEQNSKLLKNNRRLAADLYWIDVNGDSITDASLISDDEKERVHVKERSFYIEDLEENLDSRN